MWKDPFHVLQVYETVTQPQYQKVDGWSLQSESGLALQADWQGVFYRRGDEAITCEAFQLLPHSVSLPARFPQLLKRSHMRYVFLHVLLFNYTSA